MRLFRVISVLLLTTVLVAGCMRDPLIYPNGEPGALTIRVFIPENAITKAETGLVAPVDAERLIKTLQIWVFRHGATEAAGLIGYRLLDEDAIAASGLSVGHETRFTIPVDKGFVEELSRPTVDVYAVVNAPSAGLTIDKFAYASEDWSKVNPSDLLAFTLSGDCFGIENLISDIPNGLPMAGLATDQDVTGDFPVLSVSTLDVTRAVSKLRFVFCQMAENGTPVDEFHITGITLSGQIGKAEKLFTEQTYAGHTYSTKLFDIGTAGYVNLSKTFTGGDLPGSLALNPTPGDYLYQPGMTAQQYEDLIQEGINNNVLTQWGLTYLRETDKQLSGTISYTVGTGGSMRSKNAEFTLDALGDFTRNHSWTIYGYFIGGKLILQPTVLPWIAGQNRYTYNTMGSTEMKYERPWRRYDMDKKSWTWDDTYVVIAYGYKGGASGMPTRSPRITFETINQNELRVQIDNSHFRIVQVIHGTDGEGNPQEIFTQLPVGEYLSIPGSPTSQTTEVYVVPEDDSYMSDPYVNLILTEVHPGTIPPENLPYNHNLPGDEDHSTIRFYNPGVTIYNSIDNIHKQPGDEQPDVYWLEEEN